MKEYSLIPVCDAEQRGHVGRIESFDVVQHDDLTLQFGEHRQQVMDSVGETLCDERIIDPVGPRDGRLGPCSVGVEPRDEVVVATAGALFTGSGRVGAVEQHLEQPCLERRPRLESLDPAKHGQPCVLAHLFGHRTTPDGGLGEMQEVGLVAADDFDERGLVAGAQPIDESEIVIHGVRGYDSVTSPIHGHRRDVQARTECVRPSFDRDVGRVVAQAGLANV